MTQLSDRSFGSATVDKATRFRGTDRFHTLGNSPQTVKTILNSKPMKTRKLGSQGLEVSELGLGCMGMSEFYGNRDETEAIATLHRALDLGVNFLDTADMYGPFTNERLVGQAIRDRRDRVVLATKFGNVRSEDGGWLGVSGKPDYVQQSCEASLKRLGVEVIDLYYQHRVDPTVPIEETIEAMAKLVQQGKVRYLGLSEAAPATIRRAQAIHPISALQTEYSLWSRDPEDEILPTVRELGIGYVAYSPLGRGFLSGQFTSLEDLSPDDYRRNSPRFQGENFAKNLELVDRVKAIATRKGSDTQPACLGVAAGSRQRHCAHSRNQAPLLLGGKHRCYGDFPQC